MNEQQLAAVKLALVALEEWYFGCGAGSESHDDAVEAIKQAIAQDALDKMADNARELGLDYEPAPVQDLPFGVGGGLVAIKTLLGRDPCVHANTAIEMIDAILKEHPAAQPAVQEPVEVDQATMELAESVGLIGPASRTHDLHAAIQRFHDLICVNATIKAAQMAADAIREATPPAAQPAPVQEPVAWVCYGAPGKRDIDFEEADINGLPIGTLLYTTPPAPQPVPVQEPMHPEIKKMYEDYFDKFFRESFAPQPVPVKTYHDGKPWPVAPKPWVGLTDEEVENFVATLWPLAEEPVRDRLRAIEAKLKEKNA
jgi:hypothetical protein